jgi:hypothetical protein
MEYEIRKDKKLLKEIMMRASPKFSSVYRKCVENYKLIVVKSSGLSLYIISATTDFNT